MWRRPRGNSCGLRRIGEPIGRRVRRWLRRESPRPPHRRETSSRHAVPHRRQADDRRFLCRRVCGFGLGANLRAHPRAHTESTTILTMSMLASYPDRSAPPPSLKLCSRLPRLPIHNRPRHTRVRIAKGIARERITLTLGERAVQRLLGLGERGENLRFGFGKLCLLLISAGPSDGPRESS